MDTRHVDYARAYFSFEKTLLPFKSEWISENRGFLGSIAILERQISSNLFHRKIKQKCHRTTWRYRF
jgi:hypothetical protein